MIKDLFKRPKRTLSRRGAQRCEDAMEPVCECRCSGALHGAKRGPVGKLPLGDAHSLLRKCLKCNGKGRITCLVLANGLPCSKCKGTGVLKPKGEKGRDLPRRNENKISKQTVGD